MKKFIVDNWFWMSVIGAVFIAGVTLTAKLDSTYARAEQVEEVRKDLKSLRLERKQERILRDISRIEDKYDIDCEGCPKKIKQKYRKLQKELEKVERQIARLEDEGTG